MPHVRIESEFGTSLGTAPDGASYNQVVGGVEYWYQQEWSNLTRDCQQRLAPAAPAISKLSTKKGAASGGTTVTITGSGFTGAEAVAFGSSPAKSFEVTSATSIVAVSPPGSTGVADVRVSTASGTSAAVSGDRFTYGSPTITGLSASSGSVAGGTAVTVTGSGFAPGTSGTTFSFGTVAAGSVSCSSSSTCTVLSPHAAKPATVDVKATVAGKKSKKSRPADAFTYSSAPPPGSGAPYDRRVRARASEQVGGRDPGHERRKAGADPRLDRVDRNAGARCLLAQRGARGRGSLGGELLGGAARAGAQARGQKIALADGTAAARALRRGRTASCMSGAEGLVRLVVESGADLVLNALVGSAGLGPTVATLGEGIDLALANKESLVVGGELVMALAEATGARIVPVDSEHTALHQLIAGQPAGSVDRMTITASGGPFRGRSRAELAEVSVQEALAHPTWAMGGKITIDSATLMNKGLEVMEAHHLFGTPYERIDVLVHPQSLIHGMVLARRWGDAGAPRAPDMRIAISYALHGARVPSCRSSRSISSRSARSPLSRSTWNVPVPAARSRPAPPAGPPRAS